NHRDEIEKIRKQLRNKKDEEKQRMENVQDISAQIEKLYHQLGTLDQNSNDNQSLDVEWNRLEKQRNRLIQESHGLRLRGEQINDDLRKLHTQQADKQCELESIQSIRLQHLQLSDPDSYKAVIWYRNNKNLFRKCVYEPMILSLNIENQNMANYVEFIIPKRDLTAMFIFEDTDDMKLFINECHTKQNLVVHVSAIPQLTLQDFKTQAQPIAKLKCYGITNYLLDVVNDSDPVLCYLCETTKMHLIPIADESALESIDSLINNKELGFTSFFMKNFCYRIVTSCYSKQISSTNVQVQTHSFLTDSVNQQRIQQLENDFLSITQEQNQLRNDYRTNQDEMHRVGKELDAVEQRK
ncbi:unnamed protein product, partial [Didymodactylos carnosus]